MAITGCIDHLLPKHIKSYSILSSLFPAFTIDPYWHHAFFLHYFYSISSLFNLDFMACHCHNNHCWPSGIYMLQRSKHGIVLWWQRSIHGDSDVCQSTIWTALITYCFLVSNETSEAWEEKARNGQKYSNGNDQGYQHCDQQVEYAYMQLRSVKCVLHNLWITSVLILTRPTSMASLMSASLE